MTTMINDIVKKLTMKINVEAAKKFDVNVARELSFIPIDEHGSIFYCAIYSNSQKDKISDYVLSVVNQKVEYIYLTKENFDILFSTFEKIISESSANKAASSSAQNTSSDEVVEVQPDLIINDDINLDIDANDIVILDENDEDDQSDSENDLVLDEASVHELDKQIDLAMNQANVDATQNTKAPKLNVPDAMDDNVEASIDVHQINNPQSKKLGEILREVNLITDKQLEIALAESKVQGIPLGSILVKMGFIKIKDLKEVLGAQMGLKYATTEQLRALPTAISVLPEDFVKEYKVIPLQMTETSLVVGMVNPSDTKVINEIVYQTGLKPTVMLVTHVEFDNFVNTYYNPDKSDTEEFLQRIDEDEIESNQGELWQQVEKEIQSSDGMVSQLANKIITMAISRRASDIHLEPMNQGYRVRLRVDGALSEVIKIPPKVDSAVISRFKVLSKMNIAEHRRAQDGSFTLKYKNHAQDFRVNTIPVAGREKMVIRVLQPQMNAAQAKSEIIQIEGASEDDIRKIKYLVSSPNGIILSSGPTGSGKTTTLYSILRYLNKDSVNITTIEDPVEIRLEGVNQSAINLKAGITFANSLRSILRQDPDIILVGEIRDFETLEVAISASLTGHLVLSTVHTNSAAATITRLIEMGAKDYLISSTISGVVAQRLVKKLCPNCKEEYYPSYDEAKQILTDPDEIKRLTQTKIYRPKGCPNCKNTGYLGRLAVMEILVVNKQIRKMIAQNAHDVEIEEYAIKQGMNTLRMSCLKHILEGNTSIEEQIRILGLASEQ